MKRVVPKFITLIGGSCIVVVLLIVALIFLSEKLTGAGNDSIESKPPSIKSSANNEIYVNALEKLRDEYAKVKTVEMEASVAIDVIKSGSTVSGTGRVEYVAQNNKYKYVCAISENLENEGLMRNVDILFNGNKFYFYDLESKIVSYQLTEEVRLPSALPNPFFLPVEFLSNDDDGCEGCKMRLHDVKMPLRWGRRVSSISEITAETGNGYLHSLIQMPGGFLNKVPYNYQVRVVGESAENLQPMSIARVKENGTPLAEIFLRDLRTVSGINVKIPYTVEVAALDDNGRLVLRATFTITKLKINQTLADALLTPTFVGAEQFWDSDEKVFREQ